MRGFKGLTDACLILLCMQKIDTLNFEINTFTIP